MTQMQFPIITYYGVTLKNSVHINILFHFRGETYPVFRLENEGLEATSVFSNFLNDFSCLFVKTRNSSSGVTER